MQTLSSTQQRAFGAQKQCFSKPSLSSRARVVACAAEQQHGAPMSSRRDLMLAVSTATVLPAFLAQLPAKAEEGYKTFAGMATPPTSYGGYGGNANELPKYSFEYPAEWKSEVPSKVEKGTQGVDGRVVNPKSKEQRAFVITLGRAGEDNKSFKLTDIDSTFAGFAGADYYLQDALSSANEIGRSQREKDGITFFQYDIDSPDFRYLASIAVKDGKVFALFVRCPARAFSKAEGDLRRIVDTFTLL
ncbi:MAG: thylakoid lumen protein [Monoraphidium minutum]|nr:MAG: thylakoid lumen protein [Monoraphidium minutum]